MRERLTGDDDFELAHVGEVRLPLFTRHVCLREEHVAVRPRLQAPGQKPSLQRAQLPNAEPPGMTPVQLLPDRLRLQAGVLPQHASISGHTSSKGSGRVRHVCGAFACEGGRARAGVFARRPLAHPGLYCCSHLTIP